MASSLEGMRVLDFTHMLAGPLTTSFLAQLGAEVIKVETRGRGDHMRYYGSDRRYDGMSPSFIGVNSGKRSLAIDLKSPDARPIIDQLMASSHIIVENFRPGVADRLGVGYEAAKRLRQDVIYCSISAYGQTGERRFRAGVDNIVQATSGMMMVSGEEGDPPIRLGVPVIDMYTGTLAALATLSAVVRRERTGGGDHIDASMFDASLLLQTGLVLPTMITRQPQPRTGNTGFSALPTAGLFATRDGKHISLGVVQQNQFETLCQAIGRKDLLADPRFGAMAKRNLPENHAPLKTILQAHFLMHDADDLERQLNAGNVPAGAVREIMEVVSDPFLDDRGIARTIRIEGLPEPDVRTLGPAFQFSEDRQVGDMPPPWLGEHSVEVVQELGFDEAQIADFLDRGIIDDGRKGG